MSGRPVVRDARQAKLLGVVAIVTGSLLLYDAYDARGASKPLWTKFLPGL